MYLEWISQTQYRIQLFTIFTIVWGSDFLMFSWRNAVETPRNEFSILWQYAWNIRYFFVLWFFLQYFYLYRQESQVKNTRAPKNVCSVHSLQNSVDKFSWDTSLLPLSELYIPIGCYLWNKGLSIIQLLSTLSWCPSVCNILKVVIPYICISPYNTTGSCHLIIHETFDSYHCTPTWILHFSHTHVFWFWALVLPFFL